MCSTATSKFWHFQTNKTMFWTITRRWSPRGHILKFLALASKPQVLENCPVLGSRTALFLNRWNFVGKRQKPCGKSAKTFFWFPLVEIAGKKFFEDLSHLKKFFEDLFFWDRLKKNFDDLFFGEHLRLCPWPREGLSLASKFLCVLGLEPCVLDSTSAITVVCKSLRPPTKYFLFLDFYHCDVIWLIPDCIIFIIQSS